MDEAKSLQTPTSGWFPLPASELLLRENVNMHREEGKDGGEDGGMAQHFAGTCARLRCVRRGSKCNSLPPDPGTE